MPAQSKRIYLYLIIYGLIVASVYYIFQPPNNFRISHLADANEYLKIYDFLNGDSADYQVRFAIHNRIAIPLLASFLPGAQPEFNFFLVNSLFAILSLLGIFYLMKSFQINQIFILLSICFFSLHWVGPFRHNAINPINVDMAVYFFEVIFLILFIKRKYLVLLIVAPIAIAVKEIFLALLVVFLFISILWRFFFKDKSISIPWIFSILILGIATKMALNYFYPSVSPGRNSLIVMAFHTREMLLNPDHLLRWFLSLFAAFGAFIFLIMKRIKKLNFTPGNELIIHILALSFLSLSVLGGMDYTRLIFLGFPYVMISILLLGKPGLSEFLITFIISILLTRFWIILPDPSAGMKLYNKWAPEISDSGHLFLWVLTAFGCLLIFLTGRSLFSFNSLSIWCLKWFSLKR